jgi:hypothetical protein
MGRNRAVRDDGPRWARRPLRRGREPVARAREHDRALTRDRGSARERPRAPRRQFPRGSRSASRTPRSRATGLA